MIPESVSHRNARWFFTLALTVLGILFTVFVLPKLVFFFLPFVIGWLIALMTGPLVRLLEKKLHITKKIGSYIVIVLVLALILGLLWFIGATLIREAVDFIPRIPGYFRGFMEVVDRVRDWADGLAGGLPETARVNISGMLDSVQGRVLEWVNHFSTNLAGRAGSVALSIPTFLFYLIVTVVCSFLLVRERERLWQGFLKVMPPSVKRFFDMGKLSLKKALSGYLVAQIKISLIVEIILLFGFLLLRVPYALLVSLLIAFVDFLPVFGSGAILWPWIAVELVSGRFWTALWLGVIYLAVQVVRNVLSPKLMGDTMGLPPLLTLLFIFIGFKVYGIGGMIFAIPIGMVFMEVCQYGVFKPAGAVLQEMGAAITETLKKPGETNTAAETAAEASQMTETEKQGKKN